MSAADLPPGGIAIVAVNVVFTSLALLVVLARLYARYLKPRPLSAADCLIVAGLVFSMATTGVGCALSFNGGAGLHQIDATREQTATILKLFVPAQLMWVCATTCVKLSILCFYLQIVEWPGDFRTATCVVITATVCMWMAVLLRTFLLCQPFSYTWDRAISGTCGSAFKARLAVAIVNLTIDLSIVALPMPVLWRLQMSRRKKLAISGILALGLIVCAITSLRIWAVFELQSQDFTYNVVRDTIYGGLEVELGIINACLPLLQPVFKTYFGTDGLLSRVRSKPPSDGYSDDSRRWPRDPWKRSPRMENKLNATFRWKHDSRPPITVQTAFYHSQARSVTAH